MNFYEVELDIGDNSWRTVNVVADSFLGATKFVSEMIERHGEEESLKSINLISVPTFVVVNGKIFNERTLV